MNLRMRRSDQNTHLTKRMPTRRHLFSVSGTSLVEVLITLGIFMTGMVYVIRMFPFGFLSLKHDENVTIANRLAQAELERLEGRAANLPSVISPWGWDGTSQYRLLPDTDPDDLGDQGLPPDGTWPTGINMHYYTDVNKFRRVIGESTEIPVPTSMDSNGPGSVYVLQFSPIICDPRNDLDNTLQITAGSLRRKWMGSGSIASRLSSYGDYLIDYEQAKIYVKPYAGSKTGRTFVLSFGYWYNNSGTPELRSAVEYITVPQSNPNGPDVNRGYVEIDIPSPEYANPFFTLPAESQKLDANKCITAMAGFEGIDRSSDTLARSFDMIGDTAQWSTDDPYEFKLINAITGVVAFNPLGYQYQEFTARGRTPLTANVEYTVMDWHILREERHLGGRAISQADMDAKLSLRFIKKAGETMEADGNMYNGLAPDYYNERMKADVIAVDVDTGAMYTSDPKDLDPAHYYLDPKSRTRPAMEVDYQHGIIHFDPDAPKVIGPDGKPVISSPLVGKTFKIFYQAEGDWAIQTYKARDFYRRSYGDPANGLSTQEYFFSGSRVYLPRAAAGTTVALDFAYRVNDGPEVFTSGQMHQVSRDTYGANDLVYLNLENKIREAYRPNDQITITRITRVYGVSLGVRVVWRETGRGFAAGRWRKVDLQTYLTKPTQ